MGVWHTPIKNPKDAPRQGIEGGINGEIELDPRWARGLTGVEPGAHIWVFSFFNHAKEPELYFYPHGGESKHKTGLFNTRSPNRPAPIGMTLVKVLSINENRLEVKGVDALDGTPVLDIKPHLARLDSPKA
ncbi:methyltransferase [Dethiosulfatarculus sandiegensis]|uniref:Methyltransferase n=1 Tax=Dethiosulfatarculus sandiegensis TaxID=1429043 RepID=A0A0D2GIF6_9BACT|nr:methyltransferase [Dethiosulfatarculus sandiegensis]